MATAPMPARWRGAAGLVLAALLLSGPVQAAPDGAQAAPPAPAVILLSLDGVRHDALARLELPAFARMAREGARAEALLPVFPPSTFPAHTSLVTGASVSRHGIVANRFPDAQRGEFDYSSDAGFIEAEPLWAAAERQGLRAASFFWPVSQTAWRGVSASYRRAPFDAELPDSQKVDQILVWLDMPPARRPALILAWWRGADRAGHRHGPDSRAVRRALREQDAQLGRLLAGLDARALWDSTTLLLVSDHGMVAVERALSAEALLAEAGVEARVVPFGGAANVYLPGGAGDAGGGAGGDLALARRAARILSATPGLRAWPRAEVPARLRYRHPRVGDVVVLADAPFALLRPWRGLDLLRRAGRPLGRRVGAHGHDPAATDAVHGIALALGRGVPRGARLGRVSALDIAPTAARLLGIAAPAHAEGVPLPQIAPPEN